MHKLEKGRDKMTYVEENTKKLEELKKLPYEELRKIRKQIMSDPNATRADIINISVACGEKAIEEGIRGYTLEEVKRMLNIENCRIR